MASKVKENEEAESERDGATDGPLLDLSDDAVKKMIKAAKKRGYVTMDELNSVLPSEEVTSEQIEDTMAMLSDMGINVVEDEDAEDLLAAGEVELRRRRFGKAVRLEVDALMSSEMLTLLLDELDLESDDVTAHHAILDLNGLFVLHGAPRPELKDEPWPAVTPSRFAPG